MDVMDAGEGNKVARLAILIVLLIGVASFAVSRVMPEGWRGDGAMPGKGPVVITIDRTNDYVEGLPGGVFDSGRTRHMIRNSMRGGMWTAASVAPYDLGWRVDAPRAGRYELRVRYATVQSRPMEIFVNDRKLFTGLAHTTARWLKPEWFREGTVELRAGRNSLGFHSMEPAPNIDAVQLVELGR